MCYFLTPLWLVLFLLQRCFSIHSLTLHILQALPEAPPPSPTQGHTFPYVSKFPSIRQALESPSHCHSSSVPGTVSPQGLCMCCILSQKPQTFSWLMSSLPSGPYSDVTSSEVPQALCPFCCSLFLHSIYHSLAEVTDFLAGLSSVSPTDCGSSAAVIYFVCDVHSCISSG